MRLAAIFLASVALPTVALAQSATVGNENASTSAVIIEGSRAPSSTQTLRTNPDANAPPVMTAPQSCYVGQGSVAVGSYLFGGVSGSKTTLDEGCEQRADSAHLANLAVTRANLLGDYERAVTLLDLAEARMTMDREQWKKTWPTPDDQPWPDYWRP
jgi:hypothetical protein